MQGYHQNYPPRQQGYRPYSNQPNQPNYHQRSQQSQYGQARQQGSPGIRYNVIPPNPQIERLVNNGQPTIIPAPSISVVPPPPLIPTINPNIVAAVGSNTEPPSIIPGPFILLLILPLIPLLLFSIDARPPNTSQLPFSTSDIFTTGAFITITITIVICLGVYPEVGGNVWNWIKDGESSLSLPDSMTTGPWTNWLSFNTHTIDGVTRSGSIHSDTWKWHFDERYKKWYKVKVSNQSIPSLIKPSIRGVHSLTFNHMKSLRESFSEYYEPEYKPKLIPFLFILAAILFSLMLLIGNLLGSAYDNEKSSSSSSSSSSSFGGSEKRSSGSSGEGWIEREIRKRKEEKSKPEITLKRYKEECKKELGKYKKKGNKEEELKKFQKKRKSEIEILKKELKKRGLSLIGLEDKSIIESKSKQNDEKEKKSQDDDDVDDAENGTKKKKSKTDIMKDVLRRKKEDKDDKMKSSGPGWEIADTSLAQQTLAKSQMNAQDLAQKMKNGN